MLPFLFALYRFGRGIRAGVRDPEFQVLLSLAVTELGIGTMFYHGVEGWSWLDSLYFSVTTLTTVGLGDLTPHTAIGKMFTIVYLLLGIGVLFGFVNLFAHHAVEQSKKEKEEGSFMQRFTPGRRKLARTQEDKESALSESPATTSST